MAPTNSILLTLMHTIAIELGIVNFIFHIVICPCSNIISVKQYMLINYVAEKKHLHKILVQVH